MSVTKQQREQAEVNASEIQLFLYGEPESGEKLWNIATQFNITERTQYRIFARMVGDVVLGFYKQSDLLPLINQTLPGINQIKQLELELEIKKFLLPLTTGVIPTGQTELAEEIIETEHMFQNTPGLRTMAGDASIVTRTASGAYQSSQAEILARPPVQQPVAPTPDTPRWESD